LPLGWTSVLDERGMIFVSVAKSGNEENVLDRRIPLALLGAYNMMQRYLFADSGTGGSKSC
jgi:hypothetical protein